MTADDFKRDGSASYDFALADLRQRMRLECRGVEPITAFEALAWPRRIPTTSLIAARRAA